jgi:hypothetical protein
MIRPKEYDHSEFAWRTGAQGSRFALDIEWFDEKLVPLLDQLTLEILPQHTSSVIHTKACGGSRSGQRWKIALTSVQNFLWGYQGQ